MDEGGAGGRPGMAGMAGYRWESLGIAGDHGDGSVRSQAGKR